VLAHFVGFFADEVIFNAETVSAPGGHFPVAAFFFPPFKHTTF
jgi:hypothetical protein